MRYKRPPRFRTSKLDVAAPATGRELHPLKSSVFYGALSQPLSRIYWRCEYRNLGSARTQSLVDEFSHGQLPFSSAMEPNAFVAEVYRRMSLRHATERPKPSFAEIKNDSRVVLATAEYSPLLPSDKKSAILDIGFGGGWFLAACLKLDYTNLSGADFGIENKGYVAEWKKGAIALYEIENDIGTFLSNHPAQYDFIHMSHVIEHIPKYSLLWIVDALYNALKPGGILLLRTPNMEGPTPNSSLYVTLAHEYGFCGSNLKSLLDICCFDDIQFHNLTLPHPTARQRVGIFLRWPWLTENRLRHRLFGVNSGGQFGTELIVSARRGDLPPLFSTKYK